MHSKGKDGINRIDRMKSENLVQSFDFPVNPVNPVYDFLSPRIRPRVLAEQFSAGSRFALKTCRKVHS
jgi:hypothetical protein